MDWHPHPQIMALEVINGGKINTVKLRHIFNNHYEYSSSLLTLHLANAPCDAVAEDDWKNKLIN